MVVLTELKWSTWLASRRKLTYDHRIRIAEGFAETEVGCWHELGSWTAELRTEVAEVEVAGVGTAEVEAAGVEVGNKPVDTPLIVVLLLGLLLVVLLVLGLLLLLLLLGGLHVGCWMAAGWLHWLLERCGCWDRLCCFYKLGGGVVD